MSVSNLSTIKTFLQRNGHPFGAGSIAAAGAIPLNRVVNITSEAAGVAMTLPDGVVGQEVLLRSIATTGGNTAVVTPANLVGGVTLTFDANGEYSNLIMTSAGWLPLNNTATLA